MTVWDSVWRPAIMRAALSSRMATSMLAKSGVFTCQDASAVAVLAKPLGACGSFIRHTFVPSQTGRVSHLFLLGSEVGKGMRVRRSFARDLLDNIDAGINQCARLLGIVRENTDLANTKITQDSYGQAEVSVISLEAQCVVRFDGLQAPIL